MWGRASRIPMISQNNPDARLNDLRQTFENRIDDLGDEAQDAVHQLRRSIARLEPRKKPAPIMPPIPMPTRLNVLNPFSCLFIRISECKLNHLFCD